MDIVTKLAMVDLIDSQDLVNLLATLGITAKWKGVTEEIQYKRYKISDFNPEHIKVTPVISGDGNFLNINLSYMVKIEE